MTRRNRYCLYFAWIATIALLRLQSIDSTEGFGYVVWIFIGGSAILLSGPTKEEA